MRIFFLTQKGLRPFVRVKKKVKVVGYAPTPHKFFVKNLTKNFFSQKHEMFLYQSF